MDAEYLDEFIEKYDDLKVLTKKSGERFAKRTQAFIKKYGCNAEYYTREIKINDPLDPKSWTDHGKN